MLTDKNSWFVIVYSIMHKFNRLLIWKALLLKLEFHKIYNVILENVTSVFEALRLLAGTAACIDPNSYLNLPVKISPRAHS